MRSIGTCARGSNSSGIALGGLRADRKVLRGSKQDGAPVLRLLALAAHESGTVLAQRAAGDGDDVTAVLILLTEVPLAGRSVMMDAGILHIEAT